MTRDAILMVLLARIWQHVAIIEDDATFYSTEYYIFPLVSYMKQTCLAAPIFQLLAFSLSANVLPPIDCH